MYYELCLALKSIMTKNRLFASQFRYASLKQINLLFSELKRQMSSYANIFTKLCFNKNNQNLKNFNSNDEKRWYFVYLWMMIVTTSRCSIQVIISIKETYDWAHNHHVFNSWFSVCHLHRIGFEFQARCTIHKNVCYI